MIAIVNQSKRNINNETLYTLQINRKVLTTFYHNRTDGLAVCLEKAAKAARDYELSEVIGRAMCAGD